MNPDNPYVLPLLANAAAGALGLALSCYAVLRARRLLLLPLSVATFLLTNCIFQAVPLVIAVDVPFPTAPLLYARSAAAHGTFVAVAVLPLLLLGRLKQAKDGASPPRVTAMIPLILTGMGAVCVAYFLLRNSEILPLSVAIYRTASYEEYIAARIVVGDIVMGKAASGNGLASLTLAFFGPVALALLPLAKSLSRGVRLSLMIGTWLTMAIPSVLLGARMMLVFSFGYPLVLWGYSRQGGSSLIAKIRNAWKNLLIWLVCLSAGISVFQSALKSSLLEAGFLLFSRVFVAPGAVSGGYYWLFPDSFAFRGPEGIFMMPIPTDAVDFSMISLAATGFDSHANGSFLATAYSAAGYWGVLAASLILVIGCFLIDTVLLRLHRRLASLIVFANLFGILAISSVAFRVSVITHGFILGPALVLLLMFFARALKRPRANPVSSHSVVGRTQHA